MNSLGRNMKNKTKAELLELIEELQQKVERLENDVDYWQDEYNDLEEKCDDLECQIEDLAIKNCIKDINNFIWKLKLENLYTEELEEFINNYVKFYND